MVFMWDYFFKLLLAASICGALLFLGVIFLTAVAALLKRLWFWTDDRTHSDADENWVIGAVARIWGLKWKCTVWGSYDYYRGETRYCSSDTVCIAVANLVWGILPVLIILTQLYPLALALGGLFGGAFLLRYTRRFKKLFRSHVADLNAHKVPEPGSEAAPEKREETPEEKIRRAAREYYMVQASQNAYNTATNANVGLGQYKPPEGL